LPSVYVKTLGVRNKAISKLYQHFRERGLPYGLQDALSTLSPSCSPSFRRLRQGPKTRYGWVASPFPTGTLTLQEAPSFAQRDNVTFHFTPTSASWLNQVEIWFGIFSRKALKGASFRSTDQLRDAIEAFIAAYQPKAKPFVWRKREVKGSQLRNTIVNLCN
jgi:DDE superfamily endonuclease